jgi:hypothetical protein
MIFEELAAAGVPSTGENAPPSANDTVAEAIRDSGSHEDGEIMSENKSGGDEDLSNVEVNLDELISSKGSYPPALVFGRSKVNTELIKEYEEAGYFPSGDGRPPSKEGTLLPRQTRLLSSGFSSFVVSNFYAILFFLIFSRNAL